MWISQVPHSDRYEIGIKFEWFAPGHEAKNRIERHVAETSDQNK
jgi:Tfp pilus assembly protein PilZ